MLIEHSLMVLPPEAPSRFVMSVPRTLRVSKLDVHPALYHVHLGHRQKTVLHLLLGRLLVRLCEGLQALQQARSDVDRVNAGPGGLAGPAEMPSLRGLHVRALHTYS